MSNFLVRNKPEWDELEALIRQARKSLRWMTPQQLARLDVLYRRTTVHLSQVATRTTDAGLTAYLHGLTAAAHSLIYLPPRQSIWAGAWTFLFEGFARLIARTWRFQLLSAVLTLGGALVGYFVSMHDILAAYALMMPGDVRTPGATREKLLEVLRSGRDQSSGTKFHFASFLFTHNLKVGLAAMGTGLLWAIPTVFLLIYNGMLLGAFVAIHHRAGIHAEVWAWILPHGVTELGAIILFGGIGLMIGAAVVNPGLQTRAESLKHVAGDAGQMALGGALMLVAAAGIESYVRQSELSTAVRLIFAGATAVFWAVFILHGFVRERAARHLELPNPADSAPRSAGAPGTEL